MSRSDKKCTHDMRVHHFIFDRIFLLTGVLCISATLGLASCSMFNHSPGDLDWYPGLQEAINDEKNHPNRPILVFFYAEYNCADCNKAIDIILTNPGFLDRSKNFRCVEYGLEEAPEMFHRFRVTRLPAFFILDNFGNIREKILGYDFRRTLALLERHIMIHQRPH